MTEVEIRNLNTFIQLVENETIITGFQHDWWRP